VGERDESARALAEALRDAQSARVRLAGRRMVAGAHGEHYELRWERVGRIVSEYNERAVRDARRRAQQAEWTEPELAGVEVERGRD
jgi:hypothetical protein